MTYAIDYGPKTVVLVLLSKTVNMSQFQFDCSYILKQCVFGIDPC